MGFLGDRDDVESAFNRGPDADGGEVQAPVQVGGHSSGVADSLFEGLPGEGGSSLADQLARTLDKEIELRTARASQAEPDEDLKSAAASLLGAPLNEREAEYSYLLGRALKNGVSTGKDIQLWLVDQLNAMKKTLNGTSSGSRIQDLVTYLKSIDKMLALREYGQ